MAVIEPADLRPYNSFAVSYQTAKLFLLESEKELDLLLQDVADHPMPTLVLGGGTNVLFAADYRGRVVVNRLSGIALVEETEAAVKLKVAAGENWHQLVMYAIDAGCYGLENLSLIPGSVGAAPVQNIGAYGVELSSVLDGVEAIHLQTGERRVFSRAQCQLSYRNSVFKRPEYRDWMIVSVTLCLSKQPQFVLTYAGLEHLRDEPGLSAKKVSDAVMAVRQRKLPDPAVLPNAGSFFKNPVVDEAFARDLLQAHPGCPCFKMGGHCKLSAAWLLDQAGWKGVRRDGCGVHEQHALVLVNPDQGSGASIAKLARDMQQSVQQQFGVWLQPEVRIMGEQ